MINIENPALNKHITYKASAGKITLTNLADTKYQDKSCLTPEWSPSREMVEETKLQLQ